MNSIFTSHCSYDDKVEIIFTLKERGPFDKEKSRAPETGLPAKSTSSLIRELKYGNMFQHIGCSRHYKLRRVNKMEVFILPVLLGLVPAYIAKRKGRSFGLWWIYGAAILIMALPHSLLLKTDQSAIERKLSAEGLKKCPYCGESIEQDSSICRFCGQNLGSPPAPSANVETT
jgi:hypothetical protein